jgi:capsular polysaccharide export protein
MKIIIFCNNFEQYHFFRRCIPGIRSLGGSALILSHRFSIVLAARRDGFVACFLRGLKGCGEGALASDLDFSFEVRHGLLSHRRSQRIVQRVERFARSFFASQRPEQVWFWDGCNLMRQTLAYICHEFGIRTLFFQLGNFPGKLFVDRQGVNIRSEYAHNCQFFDASSEVNWDAYRVWKSAYLEKKMQRHIVSQTSSLIRFNWSYALDLVGFIFFAAPSNEKIRPFSKLLNFFRGRRTILQFDQMGLIPDGNYLLFPLQVNSGSQVLWNSRIGQIDAIRKAHEQAKVSGLILVVKPHPVEDDSSFLIDLEKIHKELGFLLVNGDFFQLLVHCHHLITLNSTAGMEAMLLGKPLDILGMAHYDKFSEADLAFYIQRFLLDIDCFDHDFLTTTQVETILERSSPFLMEKFGKAKRLCQ